MSKRARRMDQDGLRGLDRRMAELEEWAEKVGEGARCPVCGRKLDVMRPTIAEWPVTRIGKTRRGFRVGIDVGGEEKVYSVPTGGMGTIRFEGIEVSEEIGREVLGLLRMVNLI